MLPLALALLAVVVVMTARGSSTTGATCSVLHRERAAGVHPALQQLLDAWTNEGDFDVVVGGGAGVPGGGLRTQDEEDEAVAEGNTLSSSLASTPHGRGAALDVWPAGFAYSLPFSAQPGMQDLMRRFGEWAEGKGYTWGGRWGVSFGNGEDGRPLHGDWPHVEISGWQSLPFPPPDYAMGAAA